MEGRQGAMERGRKIGREREEWRERGNALSSFSRLEFRSRELIRAHAVLDCKGVDRTIEHIRD